MYYSGLEVFYDCVVGAVGRDFLVEYGLAALIFVGFIEVDLVVWLYVFVQVVAVGRSSDVFS